MYTERPLARRPYPPELVEHSRTLLGAVVEPLRAHPLARAAAKVATARLPGHAAEVRRLAAEVGADPLDLMLANLSYDLLVGSFGCSTMALATPAGPVLARNMDWAPPDLIARASCVTELPHGLSGGFVGAVGVVTGLSARGFAVALNAVAAGLDPEGYPVLLFLRRLLDEAGSFDQAVALARNTPLASAALITLVGTDNSQRVCLERSPRDCRERWGQGEAPLLVTNHYRRLRAPEACPRYDYLEAFAPRLPQAPSDEALLYLLTEEDVRQSITAQHVVARPASGSFRLFVPTELLRHDHDRGQDFAALTRML